MVEGFRVRRTTVNPIKLETGLIGQIVLGFPIHYS